MAHVHDLQNRHRIYLIGIGGTAMASLAGMLKRSGYYVAGSDEHVYPPMSTYLQSLGIDVLEGYTKEHLETFRPDLVVIGNAAAITNPEAAAVLELDLHYTSMAEAIYDLFIRGKHSVVVTGTHGKTSTTSLMAWILEASGRDPSFVVGGIPLNFNENHKLGAGEHFVIEGDEYNTAFFDKGPKFLHYHASSLIVNNIEFDHADIYDSLDSIMEAFRLAVRQVAAGDTIFANGDDVNVMLLRSEAKARWVTYGLGAHNQWSARAIEYSPAGTAMSAMRDGRDWYRFRTTMSGEHNVVNALAIIATASHLGLEPDEIQKGLESFLGIKRRMEVRGIERGVTVIDDFAHHPTAVETTLRGARGRYPEGRIWALFEPRSISSSRREFEDGYKQAFRQADRVVIGPVFHKERYLTKYGIEKMMSVSSILESLAKDGIEAEHIDDFDGIAHHVAAEAVDGDIVIVMSSGAFGGIHEKILSALSGDPRE